MKERAKTIGFLVQNCHHLGKFMRFWYDFHSKSLKFKDFSKTILQLSRTTG